MKVGQLVAVDTFMARYQNELELELMLGPADEPEGVVNGGGELLTGFLARLVCANDGGLVIETDGDVNNSRA